MADLAPGKFYGYKGHQVWLDKTPGGGWFAMVEGTSIEARGPSQGEVLSKIRTKLSSANRTRTRTRSTWRSRVTRRGRRGRR
jgi:hypothetical protein